MTLLALQRETIMILALASLTAAGVVFAVGALILLLRENRSVGRSMEAQDLADERTDPDRSTMNLEG